MLHLTELIYWNSLVEATGSCHCEDEILRKCPDLSIDCKLREFQYKIFYRRFKMVKSPLYPFLQCRGGFPGAPVYWIFGSHWGFFWKEILSQIAVDSNIAPRSLDALNDSLLEILLGNLTLKKIFFFVIHILLLAKYFIYKCKLSIVIPSL